MVAVVEEADEVVEEEDGGHLHQGGGPDLVPVTGKGGRVVADLVIVVDAVAQRTGKGVRVVAEADPGIAREAEVILMTDVLVEVTPKIVKEVEATVNHAADPQTEKRVPPKTERRVHREVVPDQHLGQGQDLKHLGKRKKLNKNRRTALRMAGPETQRWTREMTGIGITATGIIADHVAGVVVKIDCKLLPNFNCHVIMLLLGSVCNISILSCYLSCS